MSDLAEALIKFAVIGTLIWAVGAAMIEHASDFDGFSAPVIVILFAVLGLGSFIILLQSS